MLRPSPASLALSLATAIGFAAAGVTAFSGVPWAAKPIPVAYRLPGAKPARGEEGIFPAYRLNADGTATPIGRIVGVAADRVELRVFPDVVGGLDGGALLLPMETTVATLWALVPGSAKQAVVDRLNALGRQIRGQATRIAASPAFAEDYRPIIEEVLIDAASRAWKSDDVAAARQEVAEVMRRQSNQDVIDLIMPVLVERLQEAVGRILDPSWANVKEFLSSGRLNTEPLNDALVETLQDDRVEQAAIDHLLRLAREPAAHDAALLFADRLYDLVAEDPRFRQTVDRIFADPRFREDVRIIEAESAAAATDLFYLVVGRSGARIPDPLAVRILRYVIIGRRTPFFMVVPGAVAGSAEMRGLARFQPLERI